MPHTVQSPHSPSAAPRSSQRRSAVVRACHWLLALSVGALLVSGLAILLAHPRLYWGETGAVGMPSWLDLPLPFVFGQTGWARSLHFVSAWLLVSTGAVYVVAIVATRHLVRDLLPARAELAAAAVGRAIVSGLRRNALDAGAAYNVVQRLAYLAVTLVLCPAMVWTGLAMSPAATAAIPALSALLGGRQSARTVHFFGAALLALFLVLHVAMLCRRGGLGRIRAMVSGRLAGAGVA